MIELNTWDHAEVVAKVLDKAMKHGCTMDFDKEQCDAMIEAARMLRCICVADATVNVYGSEQMVQTLTLDISNILNYDEEEENKDD
jgi:hypothetical protein